MGFYIYVFFHMSPSIGVLLTENLSVFIYLATYVLASSVAYSRQLYHYSDLVSYGDTSKTPFYLCVVKSSINIF